MNITELKEQGIMVLKSVLDTDKLDELKNQFDNMIQNKQHLKQHNKEYSVANQPLLYCTSTIHFTFHDLIIDIANTYFSEFTNVKGLPGVGTCNLRRSYPCGTRNIGGTTAYHCDDNRPEPDFIKFFIYLNDVDMDSGPFTFVKGSHVDKPTNCRNPYRKSDKEIEEMYGNKIFHATANYGDLIVACTYGFHKGLVCKSKQRDMFTINYVNDKETGAGPFYISSKVRASLSDYKKQYARFLDVV